MFSRDFLICSFVLIEADASRLLHKGAMFSEVEDSSVK